VFDADDDAGLAGKLGKHVHQETAATANVQDSSWPSLDAESSPLCFQIKHGEHPIVAPLIVG